MKFSAILLFLLIIIYAVGIFGHLPPPPNNLITHLTPWILLAFAATIILQTLCSPTRNKGEKKQFALWFLLCYLLSFGLELAGVWTGHIFGAYTYGTGLGLKLLGVPLVIGLNWCVIIYAAVETLRMKKVGLILNILLTSAWLVLFDIILEPVATGGLNYWSWAGGTVPLQNYLVWGLVGFLFAVFYFWMMPNPRPEDPPEKKGFFPFCDRYFPGLAVFIQFIFILLLNLAAV